MEEEEKRLYGQRDRFSKMETPVMWQHWTDAGCISPVLARHPGSGNMLIFVLLRVFCYLLYVHRLLFLFCIGDYYGSFFILTESNKPKSNHTQNVGSGCYFS